MDLEEVINSLAWLPVIQNKENTHSDVFDILQ